MEGELIPTHGKGMIHVDPDKEIEFGTKAANALKKVVDQAHLARKFGGEKEHLFFEAWQTIGQFYRATPKIIWTKPITDPKSNEFVGFEARAEVLQDGLVICAAEASCMKDEPNWKNKPIFQLKSMSQTRAMAKALRSCFAWVVVLAGYSATPAEEMDGIDESNGKQSEKRQEETPSWWKESSSEKQHSMIRKIGKDLSLTDDGIKDKCFKIIGHPVEKIESLTKGECAKIIEQLQKERKDSK